MNDLDLEKLDVPTLASLAGAAANEFLLQQLRNDGHPHVRTSHGYVFQRLIVASPTVGELADQLGVTQQAVSKTVLDLETLGYVARLSDAQDSRVRRVQLTERGWSVVERGRAARAALQERVLAAVGPRAVAGAKRALLALLELTGGLEAVAARRAPPPSA